MLAAAQTLSLDLSFHISRAEGQPMYSTSPYVQKRLFSQKHMMAGEIKYQKARLCQNVFLKNSVCLILP